MNDIKQTSQVGIFWMYKGSIIFFDAVPVSAGLKYGDAITGIKDHADYWDEIKNWPSDFPKGLRNEYFSIPRGRVVYHADTDKFYVFHGNNIKKSELKQILKLFCLPKEKTVFEQDIHYCDFSEEEWERL